MRLLTRSRCVLFPLFELAAEVLHAVLQLCIRQICARQGLALPGQLRQTFAVLLSESTLELFGQGGALSSQLGLSLYFELLAQLLR